MSYIRMWVQLVFATKYRAPLLSKEIRYKIQEHIIQNCKEKSIYLQVINGHTDHIHCLVSLGRNQTIAQVAQLIKGESSFWINKHPTNSGSFYVARRLFSNFCERIHVV